MIKGVMTHSTPDRASSNTHRVKWGTDAQRLVDRKTSVLKSCARPLCGLFWSYPLDASGTRQHGLLPGSRRAPTALLPGATQTNFFMRAKMEKAKFVREGKMADPADGARDGYKALIKGDDHIVTPLTDKISATFAKFVPDRMAVQRVE
jgi:hypothetical protein